MGLEETVDEVVEGGDVEEDDEGDEDMLYRS